MLFILLTIAAIVIYITRPPKENYKVNPDYYDIDYNNLMECIGRAKNKQQLLIGKPKIKAQQAQTKEN